MVLWLFSQRLDFMILKVFSNLNDSIILLPFLIKESLKMHSFYKRDFAAQDMCGCRPVGMNLGAQEDLCLGQGRLQGQQEVGAQHPGGQEGQELHSRGGLLLTPDHSSPNSKSESLSCSLSQSPCPSDSGCTGGSREPLFPKVLPIFSHYFLCTQIQYFNFKGKKHIQILRLFLALPVLTHWRNLQHCAAGCRGLFLLSISSVIL